MSRYILVDCPECTGEAQYYCSDDTSREDMLKLLDADGKACRFCGARMIPLKEAEEPAFDIYSVPFPHCDTRVLHAPGKCVHCDHYPTLQHVRINNAIPFSGEKFRGEFGKSILPPDEYTRTREDIDAWGGNKAVEKES